MEEFSNTKFSNTNKILRTLDRIAVSVERLANSISAFEALAQSEAGGYSTPEISPDEEKRQIRFRVRKASWDYLSQVAATYSLERAIDLCPPGYTVFDAGTDEIMYKNVKEQ